MRQPYNSMRSGGKDFENASEKFENERRRNSHFLIMLFMCNIFFALFFSLLKKRWNEIVFDFGKMSIFAD